MARASRYQEQIKNELQLIPGGAARAQILCLLELIDAVDALANIYSMNSDMDRRKND